VPGSSATTMALRNADSANEDFSRKARDSLTATSGAAPVRRRRSDGCPA